MNLTTPTLSTFEFDVITVNAQGQESSRRKTKAQCFIEDLGNGIVLEQVAILGMTFQMGSSDTEKDRLGLGRPQHSVTIKPFFMGKYPVTQAQWQAVANLPQLKQKLNPDPSQFKGANRPVETVSWVNAVEFCDHLSRKTGREYRLPSEAEWEYACRAGTTTPFHYGETITTDLANYCGTDLHYRGKICSGAYGQGPKGEYREETTDVGTFPPNAFGLYDMHGNVREWCLDHWHGNYGSRSRKAPTDGGAWTSDGNDKCRLLRGGSWRSSAWGCRSANRYVSSPDFSDIGDGFRVVCASAWTL